MEFLSRHGGRPQSECSVDYGEKTYSRQDFLVSSGLVFLIVIIINAIFCMLTYRYFVCACLNDDVALSMFVSGALGRADIHTPYNNFLYALTMRAIYSILGDKVSWYVIAQYFLLILSYTTGCTLLILRQGTKNGIILSVVMLVGFAFSSYLNITYTLTAEVSACAGMLLLFQSAENLAERKALKQWIYPLIGGLLLCLSGFLLRCKAAIPCFVLMGVLLISFLQKAKKPHYALRFCVPFLALIVLAGSLYTTDRLLWREEEYARWDKANTSRTELGDYYGMYPYSTISKDYDEVGILESEISLYNIYAITDPEVYTEEFFRKVFEANQPYYQGRTLFESLIEFVDITAPSLITKPFFTTLVLALLLWLSSGSKASEPFTVGAWLLLFAAMYCYLIYRGRYGGDHVDRGLVFSGFLVVAVLPLPNDKKLNMRRFIIALVALCFILHISQPRAKLRKNADFDDIAYTQELKATYESIIANNHAVFLDARMLYCEFAKDSICGMPKGMLSRVIPISGWPAQHPLLLKTLQANGIGNPYRDSIGREDVYWITNNIDVLTYYICQHYAPDVRAEMVEPLSAETGINIYRIV